MDLAAYVASSSRRAGDASKSAYVARGARARSPAGARATRRRGPAVGGPGRARGRAVRRARPLLRGRIAVARHRPRLRAAHAGPVRSPHDPPNRDGAFSVLVAADTDRAQNASRFARGRHAGRHLAVLGRCARRERALVGVPQPAGTRDTGKRERVRIGGFDVGGDLNVEYSLNQGMRYRARVATLRGPCGAAEFTIRQFPFTPVPDGLYRVSFSSRSASAWYPGVRIGPTPPPSVPLPQTIFGLPGSGHAVAALPDGGYLLAGKGRVEQIDPAGQRTTVAGTGVEPELPAASSPARTRRRPAKAARPRPPDGPDRRGRPTRRRIPRVRMPDGDEFRRVHPSGVITTAGAGPRMPRGARPAARRLAARR